MAFDPKIPYNDLKRQTAAQYLRELESIGILKAQKMGKETLYLNVALYERISILWTRISDMSMDWT
jgi:hypothetical protein